MTAAAAAILFVGGIGVGYTAKPRPTPAPALYHNKSNQEAAAALLNLARIQAAA